MKRWYAVHTQANAETRAAVNLNRQGFPVYLPRYMKRRRHARRVDTVATPLFPRYLFVQLDLEQDRWHAVNSTFGVNHLVSFGTEPAFIPDEIILEIRARESNDGMIDIAPALSLKKGEPVRLLEGPMADSVGLFSGLSDKERVLVLLNFLGRQVRVRVPQEAVAAC